MTDIRAASGELARFVTDVFHALGMAGADAAAVAEVLAWANLRGVDTHGVMRLPYYVDLVGQGKIDPRARPVVRPGRDATVLIESARSAGPVAMGLALAHVTEIAARSGVGLALVSDTAHTGAVGYYAEKIAALGQAAVIITSGPPFMAYHGARVTSLATSPITIAVPGEEEPLLLDMATSLISNGRLWQARAAGEPLPPGAALDADGRPTTDAGRAATLLALGGPKGSGLSLMFECLTGVMAATPILTALAGLTGRPAAMQNATVIAIDIAGFRPLADYRREIALLRGWIKDLPRQQGVDEILLPGERGAREATSRARDGIPLPAKLWGELRAIADRLGVGAPAPLAPPG